MSQPTILKKILTRKAEEVKERKRSFPVGALEQRIKELEPCRGFTAALARQVSQKRPAVIAEIKKASPSKGLIRKNFDPESIAMSYAKYGATCLSVLTDIDFFQGCDKYMQQARSACQLPVIRKDFMIDPYQIIESRALEADCILLIAAALSEEQLKELASCARSCHLDFLVEVHNHAELALAVELEAELIGINNRDLHTFKTSLDSTFSLLSEVPQDAVLITESGIQTRDDVEAMLKHDVYGFLVGESFMRAPEPGEKLKELFFYD